MHLSLHERARHDDIEAGHNSQSAFSMMRAFMLAYDDMHHLYSSSYYTL